MLSKDCVVNATTGRKVIAKPSSTLVLEDRGFGLDVQTSAFLRLKRRNSVRHSKTLWQYLR